MTIKQYPCYDCYVEPVDNPNTTCGICQRKLADSLRKLDKALNELERR